eukprot:TRINITY_DN57234_c0_g1_i1.p1 TRINITY_DN57234_c0_g1~~TRINITY_DN57234_c0_g1_i1.p1  ORF type:complete len:528 (-),score=98.04 TRINITY_DN57234_c0_g1_i1:69-1652(-)
MVFPQLDEDQEDQMPEWCNRITVKNTFLDVAEESSESPRRQQSAPAQLFHRAAGTDNQEGEVEVSAEEAAAQAVGAASLWVAVRRAALRGRHCTIGQKWGSSRRRRAHRYSSSRGCSQQSHGSSRSSKRSCGRSSDGRCSRHSSRQSSQGVRGQSSVSRPPGMRSGWSSSRSTSSRSSCQTAAHGSTCACSQAAGESLIDGQALTSAACSRGTPPVVQWSQLGDAQAEPTESSSSAPLEQPTSLPLLLSPARAELVAATDQVAIAASKVRTQNRFSAFGEETSSSCSGDSPRRSACDTFADRAASLADKRPSSRQDSSRELLAKSQKPEEPARKKRSRGAKRRLPNRVAEPFAASPGEPEAMASAAAGVEPAPLSEENASVLALWTAKLCEKAILGALRDEALQAGKPWSRRLPLAVPVASCPTRGPEMLDIMLGMVIRCEATDAQGWGFGKVVAPASRSGQRGCFRCESVCPMLAELRDEQMCTALDITPATWQDLQQPADSSTHGRLRQKALLGRLRAARAAWGA